MYVTLIEDRFGKTVTDIYYNASNRSRAALPVRKQWQGARND
jgi:hypothetical protein